MVEYKTNRETTNSEAIITIDIPVYYPLSFFIPYWNWGEETQWDA